MCTRKKQKCLICNEEYGQLANHIKHAHSLNKEDYYLEYILDFKKPTCEVCGKPVTFISLNKGYSRYCSVSCSLVNRNKTSGNPFAKLEVIEKIKNKKKEKYGSETYNNSNKAKLTNLEKYGHISFNGSLTQRKLKKHNYYDTLKILLAQKEIEPLFSKDDFSELREEYRFKCLSCSKEFTIKSDKGSGSFSAWRIHCDCSKAKQTSKAELDIKNEIKKFYNGIIETNKYFYIDDKKKEADLYIPEFNLVIEHNGIYWHSEKFKDKNYHIDKTIFFNNLDIDIIHIREDEWINKKDIVLSIIKNRMNLSKKIYGRKTIKKEIDSKTYRLFLNENHIQGAMNSKIKLGLFYNEVLISVIGLGKSRFSKDELELHRFVTKIGYNVIGGFSKLLKGFNNVNTYCDLSHFNGKGYEVIGFKKIEITKPSYIYFKGGEVLSRYQCQKHKQKDLLALYDDSKSGYENMIINGYNRFYNCGNIKYLLV